MNLLLPLSIETYKIAKSLCQQKKAIKAMWAMHITYLQR